MIRVVEVRGKDQPVRFRTFAPVALACIGALPSTLEDRAVPVVLQRKDTAEPVDKLWTPGARENLAELARQLARWSDDRRGALALDPVIPDATGDREGDIVVPLLSIADDAGPVWSKSARLALLELFGRREANAGNAEAGLLLLADLRQLFDDKAAARLLSRDIVSALGTMEGRPWPEWKAGKPITRNQLAKELARFEIRPQNMLDGDEARKGYTRDSFADVSRRYVTASKAPYLAQHPLSEPLHWRWL